MAVLAGLTSTVPAAAQVEPPTVGERVWVSTGSDAYSGILRSTNGAALELDENGTTTRVSYDEVRSLLVQRTTGRHTGLGLVVGAGAGAALGFAWGYGPQTLVGGGWRQWEFAAYGVIPGALLGALVGSLRARDEWVEVPVHTLRLSALGPSRGSLQLVWSFNP